jgi:hypothetical protein
VALISAGTSACRAQYVYLDTNNNLIHDAGDRLQNGTTRVDVYLNANTDRDGTHRVCDAGPGGLRFNSFEIILEAVNGTVSYGPWQNWLFGTTVGTESFAREHSEVTDPVWYHNGIGMATSDALEYVPPGLYLICSIPVTVVSGCPKLFITTSHPTNGAAYTSFGVDCRADGEYSHTYILGRNWFDRDGADNAIPSPTAPSITAPASVSGAEGDSISITATATDPDFGDILTIAAVGVPASLAFSSTPGPSPVSATVSGTLGYEDAGTRTIVWTVTDGVCGNYGTATTELTVTNTDREPVVFAPLSLEGPSGVRITLDISALDPDKDLLSSIQADLSLLPQTGGAIFEGNAVKGTGRLMWTPTVYDVGKTFPVKFRAMNQLTGQATTNLVITQGQPTGVETEPGVSPTFRLSQNHPNPFNPRTAIRFSLPSAGHVRVLVFSLEGKPIATLWDSVKDRGEHVVPWTGRDDAGRDVASGVYYYRIETQGFVASRRMVLLR